jgi:hypothetical protein
MADLQATQTPDTIIAPEHDTDLEQLAKILEIAGLPVRMNYDEGAVVVSARVSGADLNRLAARHGIILRRLSERTHSLEQVFFKLTGTDAGLPSGQEMGAIR